jgi:hypothetical protein
MRVKFFLRLKKLLQIIKSKLRHKNLTLHQSLIDMVKLLRVYGECLGVERR